MIDLYHLFYKNTVVFPVDNLLIKKVFF